MSKTTAAKNTFESALKMCQKMFYWPFFEEFTFTLIIKVMRKTTLLAIRLLFKTSDSQRSMQTTEKRKIKPAYKWPIMGPK